jgi:hypothetical protein
VLPTNADYQYKPKNKAQVGLGNVNEIVLSTIEIVLSTYFQCKLAAYSKRDVDQLKILVVKMQDKLIRIWQLGEFMQGDDHDFPFNRKPHFPTHYAEYILLWGVLFDTETYEKGHQDLTVHTFNRTSKRLTSVYAS